MDNCNPQSTGHLLADKCFAFNQDTGLSTCEICKETLEGRVTEIVANSHMALHGQGKAVFETEAEITNCTRSTNAEDAGQEKEQRFLPLNTLSNSEQNDKSKHSLKTEVSLKRDPQACMDVLNIRFGDPDVHLICLDGIVAVHSFIMRSLSSFLDKLFDQQEANFPEIRKVLLPDFKSVIVEKATKVMYSGFVRLRSKTEADFILEIFEVLKVDRFDRLSITIHPEEGSKEEGGDKVLEEVFIKEENSLEFECGEEIPEIALIPTITSVQSIQVTSRLPFTTKEIDIRESSTGTDTSSDSDNVNSSTVQRSTRTLRPRDRTRKIIEPPCEGPEEVEEIGEEGIKTDSNERFTQSPPSVEVHKAARKSTRKAKPRSISSDEEEYALENSLSSSSSDSEEDPEYVAPKKPKLWMPPKKKPPAKFGALRLARKERITALYQKAVASRQQKAFTQAPSRFSKQGSSNVFGNRNLPGSSSISGGFGPSATAALQALSTRHQSIKSSPMPKPLSQALPTLEKNFTAKPPTITAGGMLITPIVNSLATTPPAKLAASIASPANAKALVNASGLTELTRSLRTECAERYLDRDLYLKHAKICGKCGKEYSNIREAADCLQKHKVVRCYFCFAIFANTEVLFEHYSVTHGSACPICHKIVPFQSASMHAIKDHLFEKKPGAASNNANVPRKATVEGPNEEGTSILGMETETDDNQDDISTVQESIRVIDPTPDDPDTHVVLCASNFNVKMENIEEEDAEPFRMVNYS